MDSNTVPWWTLPGPQRSALIDAAVADRKRRETEREEARIAFEANLSAWQTRTLSRQAERLPHPTDKLADVGATLRKELEFREDRVAMLEISLSIPQTCNLRDCFYRDRAIADQFRVRINKGAFWRHQGGQRYYHVLCFLAMMDVEDMVPDGNFILSPDCSWGLMVDKWMEHRGRINLDVLAIYLRKMKIWELDRQKSAVAANGTPPPATATVENAPDATIPGTLATQPSPAQDDMPVLRGYITPPDTVTSLLEVTEHELVREGVPTITFSTDENGEVWVTEHPRWPDALEEIVERQKIPCYDVLDTDIRMNRPRVYGVSYREMWDVIMVQKRHQEASQGASGDGQANQADEGKHKGDSSGEDEETAKRRRVAELYDGSDDGGPPDSER